MHHGVPRCETRLNVPLRRRSDERSPTWGSENTRTPGQQADLGFCETPGIGTLQRLRIRTCGADPGVDSARLSCAWPARARVQRSPQALLGPPSSLHLGQTRSEGIGCAPIRTPRGVSGRRAGRRLRFRVRARTVSLRSCNGLRLGLPASRDALVAPIARARATRQRGRLS